MQCYYHRTVDDPEGLTFVLWKTKRGERLVVNSCELRAVQGRQECDFKLTLPQPPPPLRQQLNRVKKKQRPQDGTELFASGQSPSGTLSPNPSAIVRF